MPRHEVSDTEAAKLLARLSEMAVRERTGVDTESVRVGISDAMSPDLAAAFRRAWSDRGDPRLHGRRLVVELIGPAGDAGVFAVLFAAWPPASEGATAGPVRGAGQGEVLGAPVLFPVAPLQGGEDPGIVHGLFASRADQMAALLAEAPASALPVPCSWRTGAGVARSRAPCFRRARRGRSRPPKTCRHRCRRQGVRLVLANPRPVCGAVGGGPSGARVLRRR